MKTLWRFIVGTCTAGVALSILACGQPTLSRQRAVHPVALPEAEYVGMSKCLLCHEGQDETLEGTRHWMKNDPRTPISSQGCESCHGPGSAHVMAQLEEDEEEDGGGIESSADESTGDEYYSLGHISFNPKYPFPAEQLNAQCLACHQRDRTHFQMTSHASNGVACVDCHQIHSSKHEHQLQKASTLELCGSCHVDQRTKMERQSHHPVREGKMECTDCHDPHGTGRDSNLRADSANDLCYECHTEKRGPHLWEHAPVFEDCANCHDPHGSVHDKLLIAQPPYLCQRCHLDSRHPGTLRGGHDQLWGNIPGVNPAAQSFGKSCIQCHSRIHGSNHPSGETLTR